jgi:hypothetical protein
MDAGLAELKWAAVTRQMKLEEREEQRRIKKQLREWIGEIGCVIATPSLRIGSPQLPIFASYVDLVPIFSGDR